jgi:hypothetical protein
MSENVLVVNRTYDLIVDLVPQIARFPRSYRFVLGERIERDLYSILDGLLDAQYGRDRTSALRHVNVELERLRFRMRLAKDLRIVSIKRYETVAAELIEIGKMVGGWLRSQRAP